MASPVARDPCNQRRRTPRVQRTAAIGAESSRATTWMQTTWTMSARMSSRLRATRDGSTVREKKSARHQAIAIGSPYRRLLIPC
jgi:hypothetical protein